ncbi:hypothetical protein DBR43_03710 [Pedobacter sp. KBW06]|uniref:hypothetical protein n=1 Tax=Pedobacter sp. KBW06 TaxID=2153359 RepID=UPI000F5A9B0A|nr:hypothetical protein [Pedobacter sp. KBW06]RQO74507.1 hypothetical protein DBR43_03710 [Pedobacter sp. KBW06]
MASNNLTRILVLSCLLSTLTVQISQAQTFAEFFKQKKTQKKYLLQQIAALQVYIGYAKKGYNIASSGLQTIKDITNGEFSLHSAFISSLKTVSPVIRKHVKVAEIIEYQIKIGRAFGTVKYSPYLSVSNQLYVIGVHEKIIQECGKDLEELFLVITSGKVEMTDEERLRRLDIIYESIVDKYAFTMDFIGQVRIMINQAEREEQFINHLRKYYEIN